MRIRHITIVGLTMLLVAAGLLNAQTTPDARPWGDQERQGNVWGINLGWEPGWSTVATVRMLGMARNLVGDWGYIRHGMSPKDDVAACKRSIAMIRAHRLINIAGGAYPNEPFRDAGKPWATLDPDGTMRTAARDKVRIWREMYEASIPFYTVEVMNEVNMGDGFPPEKYAQWLHDFAVEVKKAYPGLKVCSAGMAGSGADYYDEMLKLKPELKDVVDFWGLHPYGANNPPEYGPRGVALRCYVETIEVLERHDVDPIRLMCTETGYELEIGDVGKNTAYPPIKEENRAEYMARAYRDYWEPDQRIEMVAPFILWDLPWHGWDGWNYLEHDGVPKPIYNASAAAEKKPGNDFMPTGEGRIEGRITWRDTNIGIPRVIVYTEPKMYGAVTDSQGHFTIRDLPDGNYTVNAFADGYTGAQPKNVKVSSKRPVTYEVRMHRESLVSTWQMPTNSSPPGWTPLSELARGNSVSVDPEMRAPDNQHALRIAVRSAGDIGAYSYSPYNSAYPNEVYIAEVHVRGLVPPTDSPTGGAPYLELAATTGSGELLATARATNPDFKPDGNWYRITAAMLGPPRTSRVRISLGAENSRGRFWFSKPFVGEADFPLPGDVDYKTTAYVPPHYEMNRDLFAQTIIDIGERNPQLKTSTVTGRIKDFRGRGIACATITSESPVFVAVADDDGRFELTVPIGETLRIRAFAPGVEMALSEPLRIAADEETTVDLQCAAPTAPAGLVNGSFDKFTKEAPGLLHGWNSFGATDGTTASGRMIFEVPSYQGEGLYFAQSGSNVKNGGALQTVQAVPGTRYRFSGMVYTRTEGGGKRELDNNCRLGIDPTGGRDPESEDVVWTQPAESDRNWTNISVEATAETERLTVFIRHEMRRANTWNLCLFDEVKLEEAAR